MKNKKFTQLSSKVQTERCIIPWSVSITVNPDEEKPEQFANMQEKFLSLSESIKNKLVSPEIGRQIQQIGKMFNLELLQMASIARAIRSYYFGEIKLEAIPVLLSKEIGIDITRAQEIAKIVNNKIIGDKSQEQAYKSKLVKLPISQSLKEYPKTGEQSITSSPIKLKHFPAPARPSIKNWIADFHQKMGMEKHGMMERSEYLFNSENAKSLTSTERQKLAYILKSLDENMLLTIDAENEQIIFPEKPAVSAREPLPPRKPETQRIEPRIPSPPPSPKGRGGIEKSTSSSPLENLSRGEVLREGEKETDNQRFHFSSPHKFITEEERSLSQISPMGRLSGPQRKSEAQKKNPKVNKNTVDLRRSL